MCAHYELLENMQRALRSLRISHPETLDFQDQIFPRHRAPVIVWENGGRALRAMHFGLIPAFEKSEKPKKVFHNARSETITEKPSFRRAFTETRCLVPMSGFYEYIWEDEYTNWLARFMPADGRPLLYAAGLWNRWQAPDGTFTNTFTILTREPPESISRAGQDRCPVFLRPDAWDAWLDPEQHNPHALLEILSRVDSIPFNVEEMIPPPRGTLKHKGPRPAQEILPLLDKLE